MKTFDPSKTFDILPADFSVVPAPKYIERRGYIYLLQDTAFPDHIKIGRTANLHKRLAAYNEPKPFATTYPICISREFSDVIQVEEEILGALYRLIAPTTFRKEWFLLEHKDLCLQVISEAETEFL